MGLDGGNQAPETNSWTFTEAGNSLCLHPDRAADVQARQDDAPSALAISPHDASTVRPALRTDSGTLSDGSKTTAGSVGARR